MTNGPVSQSGPRAPACGGQKGLDDTAPATAAPRAETFPGALCLRQLVDAAWDCVLIEQDGVIVYANMAAARLLGADRTEMLINRPIDESVTRHFSVVHATLDDAIAPAPVRLMLSQDGPVESAVETGGQTIKESWAGRPALLMMRRGAIRTATSPPFDSDLFRQAVDAMPDALIIHRNGKIRFVNQAAVRDLHAPNAASLIGRSVFDFIAPTDHAKILDHVQAAATSGKKRGQIAAYRRICHDGQWREVETAAAPVQLTDGDAILHVCRDVTEHKRAERALLDNEERFNALVERSPEATIAVSQRRIVLVNPAAVELFEVLSSTDLIGLEPTDFCDPETSRTMVRQFELLERGEAVPIQMRGRIIRPGGTRVDVIWISMPFTWHGQPAAYVILRDVTEQLVEEERHRYLASHDPLTGVPNRLNFGERLQAAVQAAGQSKRRLAVHYLDLDYFKNINDTLGHAVGDQLLRYVAARLIRLIGAHDIVGRLGGDEFAILQTGVQDEADVHRLAEKIVQKIDQPFSVGDHLLHTSATIGAAIYPDHSEDPEDLCHKADLALYRAKDLGRNAISIYSTDLSVQIQQRSFLASEVALATAKDEFEIYYQPVIDLCNGRIEAVEALLRWHHPTKGLLSADHFIHALEASYEAPRIGVWVVSRIFEEIESWQAGKVRLSINLFMPLLQRPDLVAFIANGLKAVGLPPDLLELELTEQMIVAAGTGGVLQKLIDLRKLGVGIALDDFGTGSSSLALLKTLPIDRIKIDRSFVAGFGRHPEDTAIVQAILCLGQNMQIRVTAEGVEHAETLVALKEQGCNAGQGYYLARPMPAARLRDYLADPKHTWLR